jgi:hypothetical protein
LEDLSFLRGAPAGAATAHSARATFVATAALGSAAEAAMLIPEPRLSFASRLSRATCTAEPAHPKFNGDMVPETENPFAPDTQLEWQPDEYQVLDIDEQPDMADMLPGRQQADSQHRRGHQHGSDEGQPSPDEDNETQWRDDAKDASEEAPRRKAFKRLRKKGGSPGALSPETAAAGMGSLADWTDDDGAEVCSPFYNRSMNARRGVLA